MVVLSTPLLLGGASFLSKALPALGGFFDNSAAQEAHRRNVQRVAQIDAQNQLRIGRDRQAFASYRNRGVRAQEQLFNIDQEVLRTRGRTALEVDRAQNAALAANQDAFVKTRRRMTGSRTGRMNLDSAFLSEYGRGVASRLNNISLRQDDAISQGYNTRFAAQNQAANTLARVGPRPVNTPLVTSYTPERARGRTFADTLKLGSGLLSAGLSGYNTFQDLQPGNIFEDENL